MSKITIKGMRFYANHGCFEEEQTIGTYFMVDMIMTVDTTKAQLSDDINDTVNYLEVYRVVKKEMMKPSHLLEHVANRIGKAVLSGFSGVSELQVTVHKLNPPLGGQMDSVALTLDFLR